VTGNAAQILWDTDRSLTGSLKKLVSILKSRYSGERQAEKYRAELQIRRRRGHETLSELHQDIRRLMALAYPRLTVEAREEIACDHFTNALSDPDFALKVKERAPKTLDEALNVALRLEAWEKSVKHSREDEDRPDRPRQKARAAGQSVTFKEPPGPGPDAGIVELEAKVTRLTEELKRLSEIPRPPKEATVTQGVPAQSPPVQKQRAEATVSAGEGPRPLMTQERNYRRPVTQNRASHPPESLLCWGCGLPGHIRRDCPSNRPGISGILPNRLASRGSRDAQDNADVYIMMKLFGKEVPCLVDSGCDRTIVPKDLTDRCQSLKVWASTRQIWAANNTPIRISGEAELPFKLNGRCLWTPVLISEDVVEVMLGIDWLEDNNCAWDFKSKRLTIDGRETVHVDKLRPWNTGSPPRSWLTDVRPGKGNEDHGWSAEGDAVSGMVDK